MGGISGIAGSEAGRGRTGHHDGRETESPPRRSPRPPRLASALALIFSLAACGGDAFGPGRSLAELQDGAAPGSDAQPQPEDDALAPQDAPGDVAQGDAREHHDARADGPEPAEGGEIDAGTPDAPPVCVTDLSNVGTGDFRITFDVKGIAGAVAYALVNQRSSCEPFAGWAMYTSTTGAVEIDTDDGTASGRTFTVGGSGVNDGQTHHVVGWRLAGKLYVSVDQSGASQPSAPPTSSLGALPPLVVGQDACATEATPLVGSVTNLCIVTH